jgi:O-antigen/teichoic acid export membrane protein
MSRVLLSIGVIQMAIMLIALVRAKVLSVLLGPAGYGVASTIDQTVLSTMQLAHLSLPFTAMKFMSNRHSDGHEPFERTFATFFRALSIQAVIAVAIVAALLTWRPTLFGSDLGAYRPYFLIAVLSVPAAMLNVLFVNTLASAQRGASSAMLNMLVLLALAAAAIVGVALNGIQGLYVATVATGVGTTLGSIWYLHRTLDVRVTAPTAGLRRELRQSPEIVRFAMLIYVAMSAYSLTMLGTRYFVFEGLGAVGAGLLQALLGIALTVGNVMTPMNGLFFTPYVNRQLPVETKIAAADDFAGKITLLLLLAGVVVALFPRIVLTLLFSNRFAPAAAALSLFVVWQCLYQIVNVYLQLLIGLDDVAYFAIATVLGYATAALAFPTLIARFGLGGAALALSLAMLVAFAAALLRLRRKFATTVSPLVMGRAAFSLAAHSIAGRLFDTVTETTLAGIGARGAYVMLVVVLAALTLSRAERSLIASGLAWGRVRLMSRS